MNWGEQQFDGIDVIPQLPLVATGLLFNIMLFLDLIIILLLWVCL